MCEAIRFEDYDGKQWTIRFEAANALLPIRRDGDHIQWMTWGKRRNELSEGFLPGGWVRNDSLLAGKWDKYKPEVVRIAAHYFLAQDARKRLHWLPLAAGECLHGLIANIRLEQRLYIITQDVPAEYDWVQSRWPKLT